MTNGPPIGTSNFAKIINKNLLYCDKTLFIKEFIEKDSEVELVTRSRRWGKSLNMSMLEHFLAPQVCSVKTAKLFTGLKIEKENPIFFATHQGKYPVISLSFKDIKIDTDFDDFINEFSLFIYNLYDKYRDDLTGYDPNKTNSFINDIFNRSKDKSLLKDSLSSLSKFLSIYNNNNVYILIDEYDAPLNYVFKSGNIKLFNQLVSFFGDFLSKALKDNPYLAKGLLTGILRILKDSMLSGLNNIDVFTLLDEEYHQYYGFSEAEVIRLFTIQGLDCKLDLIKSWYNGYKIGGTQYYNPWSIMNCLTKKGKFDHYWANVANNDLVESFILKDTTQIDEQFARLMSGESINAEFSKEVTFEDLYRGYTDNESTIYSLLVATGYLTLFETPSLINGIYSGKLIIPNLEIRELYNRCFIKKYKNYYKSADPIKCLLNEDINKFCDFLQETLRYSMSTFDNLNPSKKNIPSSEQIYHNFMTLYLCSGLYSSHRLISNSEAGEGRLDLAAIPKIDGTPKSVLGLIFEFKHLKNENVGPDKDAKLLIGAKIGLDQIIQKNYLDFFNNCPHVERILKIGMAFSGKQLSVAFEVQQRVDNKVISSGTYPTTCHSSVLVSNTNAQISMLTQFNSESSITHGSINQTDPRKKRKHKNNISNN